MQTQAFWSKECQEGEPDLFVCIKCLNEVFWRKVPSPDCPTCHAVSTYEPFTIEAIEDWGAGAPELIDKARKANVEKFAARLEGKL